MKITIIGAGSLGFTKRFILDILSFPNLRNIIIALNDIDQERLNLITKWTYTLKKQENLNIEILSSTDRKDIINDSDYIINTIRVGGLEAFELDLSIPRKYGIHQAVGDTVGPGGVFYGLRTVPVLLEISDDIKKLCPSCWFLNYTNPMAINTWAMIKYGHKKVVGLCHSIQGTAWQLSNYIGVPFEEVYYWAAGINHMSWFLEFKRNREDLYPLLFKAMENPEIYKKDPVRFEIMRHFGYFVSESSYHMAEYVPYFNKRKELIDKFNTHGWIYLDVCKNTHDPATEKLKREAEGKEKIEIKRSNEYCAYIINALETGEVFRFNGNVINDELIDNLPYGCCVEVPCYAEKGNIRPAKIGSLPPQCAALNRLNINVQELVVEAAVRRKKSLVYQAVSLDPLTGAVLSLEEIRKMVDEMFEKEKKYLPEFSY
ncbi:MAG: alpha-glucosidase/alpha-galactosidase [Candidatus Omnitrophica bacterium]|nr:alpha-glucosidase/alpha-galactosidase [Candidatus Omnitrophota bacterium]MCM8803045.1 alpha-glucosidase/alpha-galactosidase [Candidatus Omnitrophota bacterium]